MWGCRGIQFSIESNLLHMPLMLDRREDKYHWGWSIKRILLVSQCQRAQLMETIEKQCRDHEILIMKDSRKNSAPRQRLWKIINLPGGSRKLCINIGEGYHRGSPSLWEQNEAGCLHHWSRWSLREISRGGYRQGRLLIDPHSQAHQKVDD